MAGRRRDPAWLGTERPYDGLTFLFAENEHGQFGAHVYPYRPERATFIVETDEETARRAGLDAFTEADTIAYCQRLYPGHRLLANRSASSSSSPHRPWARKTSARPSQAGR